MRYLGINCLNHDAAMAVVEDDNILWAAHSERYSKIKNDQYLNWDIVQEAYSHGPFDKVIYYEHPYLKKARQLRAGQFDVAFDLDELPNRYLKQFNIEIDEYVSHHHSHMAGGYYTAPGTYWDADILTIDAIGEFETITLWNNQEKVKSWRYPYSLGLLYSAMTQRIGLKPNEEEYITMGMAAYGEPKYYDEYKEILDYHNCHKGIPHALKGYPNDIAASAQLLIEEEIIKIVKNHCPHKNLVMMGGVALNCVANSRIAKLGKDIWIMPNPGDCGSSLGAAALTYGKKIKWENPYLGTEIKGDIDVKKVVEYLLKNHYCGIAHGCAEFGPRALGNRSLIADPRRDIKNTVNKIKRREAFRPFAPAILEEYADEYFEGPMNEYMQFVAMAKHDHYSVTHIDGSARVQIVKKDCKSIIRRILEHWYDKTSCPMLLNTSLNIKGQPIVDNENDKKEFMKKYKVKVF